MATLQVALPVMLTMLVVSGCVKTETKTFPVLVEVKEGNVLGANTDTNALDFSIVPPNAGGTRQLTLTNTKNRSCTFSFQAGEELREWLTLPENLVVGPGEEKTAEIRLHVPEGATEGKYRDTLSIYTAC